jgi:hypothetical protein
MNRVGGMTGAIVTSPFDVVKVSNATDIALEPPLTMTTDSTSVRPFQRSRQGWRIGFSVCCKSVTETDRGFRLALAFRRDRTID